MFLDLPQPLQDAFWATVMLLLVTYVPGIVVLAVNTVVRGAKELWASFKGQQPEAANKLEQATAVAVAAAEQMGFTGQLLELGLSKKEYAVDYVQKLLLKQGIKLDLQLIDGAVEAAVRELFPKQVAG